MTRMSPSRRMPLSPATLRRSTRKPGLASRKFISGIRLWPPASTRGSASACSVSSPTASSRVVGAAYEKGGGFTATSRVSRLLRRGGRAREAPARGTARFDAAARTPLPPCAPAQEWPQRAGMRHKASGPLSAGGPEPGDLADGQRQLELEAHPAVPQTAPDELLDAAEPVGDRVAVHDEGIRRRGG